MNLVCAPLSYCPFAFCFFASFSFYYYHITILLTITLPWLACHQSTSSKKRLCRAHRGQVASLGAPKPEPFRPRMKGWEIRCRPANFFLPQLAARHRFGDAYGSLLGRSSMWQEEGRCLTCTPPFWNASSGRARTCRLLASCHPVRYHRPIRSQPSRPQPIPPYGVVRELRSSATTTPARGRTLRQQISLLPPDFLTWMAKGDGGQGTLSRNKEEKEKKKDRW
jgi:hypothetical protein